MVQETWSVLLQQIRTLAAGHHELQTPDGELMNQFLTRRDEAAFEALLRRHGPMVFRTACRILGSASDAEDVFQATFLLLVRRGETIRQRESVAGWLHGVAHRLALTARVKRNRRQAKERQAAVPEATTPAAAWTELEETLHDVLAQLPEKYRTPLVYCYLEGWTQEELARHLGRPLGTVRSWLARGRELLRKRLLRRGVSLSTGAALLAVACAPASAVPVALRTATRQTAVSLLVGGDALTLIAPPVAELMRRGATAMLAAKLRRTACLLVLVVLMGGTGAIAQRGFLTQLPKPPPVPPWPAAAGNAVKAPAPVAPRHFDALGDPLPPGVVVRLGTERLTMSGMAFHLTFSPDGRRLAGSDRAEQLHVWEVDSGKELLRFKSPVRDSAALGFSPDGKLFAMGARIWELDTAKELPPGNAKWRTIDFISPTRLSALSRDGKTRTAGRFDAAKGRKWIFIRTDVASGKEIGRHEFKLSEQWIGELSPDGSLLAKPDEDGKSIALVDPLTGREMARAHGSDYPAGIVFSADGSLMTCRSKRGIVHVWETATGKVRKRIHALSTGIDRIALSPDGKRVALTGRADDAVHIWDVAAGREMHAFAGHRSGPLAVVFLKGGKEIATTSRAGSHDSPLTQWPEWSLRRWDAATGAERAVTRADPKGEVYYTVFSPNRRRLATVVSDGTLRLWDVESGKELRNWKVPTRNTKLIERDNRGGQKVTLEPHPAISEPAFSPDGKMLFAAHGSRLLRWEIATGREMPALEVKGERPNNSFVRSLSPDGRTLIVQSGSVRRPKVDLLNAADCRAKQRLQGIEFWSLGPAFSPDGRTFAVGEINEVSLWETASGRSRGRLLEQQWTYVLAFSPDGRFLAAGSDPGATNNLTDLATGEVAGQLPNDFGRLLSLTFSPDGSRLAVTDGSPTVLVCDVAALCGKKKMDEIAKGIVPSAEELERLWAELSGIDGVRAYRAIRRLGLTGSRGATFVKARLQSVKLPDERSIPRWIADLDADKFATREKAFGELAKLGVRAEPALRWTLEGEVSAEARARIKRLLDRLGAPAGRPPSVDLIRRRVVEALEANSSKEARQVLTELAKESTDAELAREAKASLERLSRRLASAP